MTAYIYSFSNTITKQKYFGSTLNPKRRRGEHFSDLRGSRHDNCLLQASFDEYGEYAFEFEILEECSIDDRLAREQFYLDSGLHDFNLGRFAQGGAFDFDRHPRAKEIRAHLSTSKKGIKKTTPVSDETREKIRQSKLGEKNYRFGGYYLTPWGAFASATEAARHSDGKLSRPSVLTFCRDPQREITAIAFGKCPFLHSTFDRSVIGKTYADLGFGFQAAPTSLDS